MSLRLSTTFFIFFRLQPRELCSLRQLVYITKLTPPCQPLFLSFFFPYLPFPLLYSPLLTSYTPCIPLPADLYINISQRCRYFWNSDQCRFSAYPDPAPDFAVRNADIQIMIVRRSVIAQAQSTFQQVKHFIHVTLLTSAKIASISRICRPVHSNSYNVVWSSFWYVCRHSLLWSYTKL